MQKALVRVEYIYDPDSRNWGYEVPSLNIIGGAGTREAAEEQAIAAIAYSLDCAHERSLPSEGEVGYLQVTVDRERAVDALGARPSWPTPRTGETPAHPGGGPPKQHPG
jgi:hypothetical protein